MIATTLAFIAGWVAAGMTLLLFAAWTTRDLEEVEREYNRRHLAAVPGGRDLARAAQPTFVANSPELALS
jgi:hypothetical protein